MNIIEERAPIKIALDAVATGCLATFLFNPLDRALYLMVKDGKPFGDFSLWKNPYQGVSQALYSRIIGYGAFFAFNDAYKRLLANHTRHSTLGASILTGLSTVMMNHPINVVKMYSWSHGDNKSLLQSSQKLVKECGLKVIFKGINYTCARDILFATTFLMLSEKYNAEKNAIKDTIFASFATAITSPINFARNRVFFDFKTATPTLKEMGYELMKNCSKEATTLKKIDYVLFRRFNVGWGTMRVGIGMAFSKQVYTFFAKWQYL